MTSKKTELRGSLIIHHDTDEETDNVEVNSAVDSIDISEDEHEPRQLVEEVAQPLNEIEEVEEEDDEVVTVLKTPRALYAKANFPTQDELLESPLAAKSNAHEEMDSDVSDKENVPTFFKAATPRPSDRSDSYVTAVSNFPPEEVSQESQLQSKPVAPIDNTPHEEEQQIIETQVPVATSPPENQMQLPSLPTRAPLNMKKSFGVRKSHRTSLMESIAGRTSIIPNRKTFFGQAQASEQPETTIKYVEAKIVSSELAVTPIEEVSNTLRTEETPPGKKEKDDTITIIDTELHLGDQRLKTKFTTESQRIHDALNSLKIKSTPGQPLRDAQERIVEMETPAPLRMAETQSINVDENEDWIPKKDYSSLVERFTNDQNIQENVTKSVEMNIVTVEESEIPRKEIPAPVEKEPAPPVANPPTPAAPLPPASPASSTFKNAAAQAVEVIRNAMAMMTNPNPHPPPSPIFKQQNIYPDLTGEPMTDIQPSENFTIHYDDRQSLDSHRDSTYFTQSDAPSQPSQVDIDPVPQDHRKSHTAMPPPRKDQLPAKPKPVPVSIRVPTASQRQKEQQKKAFTQGTGIYPSLTQSKSVPDLATPGKMARDEARMSNISVQSTGSFMRGGQIRALNAAKLAKQKVIYRQGCD